ncbi:hypothetical protein [Acuticoccus sediminis]|uniref:hypothetical protein n=1 Tax=Acuticoccus sediminis TaxID=2184697 RepID=UPI001CFE74BD|nr:hypothetical protein [Acuticoccus sediminis]
MDEFYLDFAFVVGREHLVLTGWGHRDAVAGSFALLSEDAPVLEAETRFFHKRPDVSSRTALGFVLIFPGAGARITDDAMWRLRRASGASVPVTLLPGGLPGFVDLAVDEPFVSVLCAVADGALPPLTGVEAERCWERVKIQQRVFVEQGDFAAAIDQAILDAHSGHGLVSGWVLSGSGFNRMSTYALRLSRRWVGASPIAYNSVRRPDLFGFRDRFHVSGTDGFAGRLSIRDSQDARVALILESENSVAMIAAKPKPAPFDDVLMAFASVAEDMHPAPRKRLQRALARAPARQGAPERSAHAPERSAHVPCLVLLEHDARANDLRFVLSRLMAAIDGPATILVTHETHDDTMEKIAGDIAASLGDERITVLTPSRVRTAYDTVQADLLIAIRSSLVVQSDAVPRLLALADGPETAGWIVVSGWNTHVDGTPEDRDALLEAVVANTVNVAVGLRSGRYGATLASESHVFATDTGRLLYDVMTLPQEQRSVHDLGARVFSGASRSAATLGAQGKLSRLGFDGETIRQAMRAGVQDEA